MIDNILLLNYDGQEKLFYYHIFCIHVCMQISLYVFLTLFTLAVLKSIIILTVN